VEAAPRPVLPRGRLPQLGTGKLDLRQVREIAMNPQLRPETTAMQNIVIDQPYRFVPPHAPLLVPFFGPWLPRYLNRSHGIESLNAAGTEHCGARLTPAMAFSSPRTTAAPATR